eukprot:gnl/MRDRNA2_/MRDRNA2_65239_c0_seq1.p2 gnl/MRDRNA2_/MRDRNA2_65239_c0~~gnl/MRDRNA2_/MRDRNA2_65239_c0_seq1.p2  ORF type:complete len:116 (-),score=15.76 gnl/MRDRNA2_/MRDRNA2_65239_c0_seq1:407-754(-)
MNRKKKAKGPGKGFRFQSLLLIAVAGFVCLVFVVLFFLHGSLPSFETSRQRPFRGGGQPSDTNRLTMYDSINSLDDDPLEESNAPWPGPRPGDSEQRSSVPDVLSGADAEHHHGY